MGRYRQYSRNLLVPQNPDPTINGHLLKSKISRRPKPKAPSILERLGDGDGELTLEIIPGSHNSLYNFYEGSGAHGSMSTRCRSTRRPTLTPSRPKWLSYENSMLKALLNATLAESRGRRMTSTRAPKAPKIRYKGKNMRSIIRHNKRLEKLGWLHNGTAELRPVIQKPDGDQRLITTINTKKDSNEKDSEALDIVDFNISGSSAISYLPGDNGEANNIALTPSLGDKEGTSDPSSDSDIENFLGLSNGDFDTLLGDEVLNIENLLDPGVGGINMEALLGDDEFPLNIEYSPVCGPHEGDLNMEVQPSLGLNTEPLLSHGQIGSLSIELAPKGPNINPVPGLSPLPGLYPLPRLLRLPELHALPELHPLPGLHLLPRHDSLPRLVPLSGLDPKGTNIHPLPDGGREHMNMDTLLGFGPNPADLMNPLPGLSNVEFSIDDLPTDEDFYSTNLHGKDDDKDRDDVSSLGFDFMDCVLVNYPDEDSISLTDWEENVRIDLDLVPEEYEDTDEVNIELTPEDRLQIAVFNQILLTPPPSLVDDDLSELFSDIGIETENTPIPSSSPERSLKVFLQALELSRIPLD